MSQELCREGLFLSGLELYWEQNRDVRLSDLARRHGTSRHVLARIVGGKQQLLEGMERFLGGELVDWLREIADRDQPALDRIYLILHTIIHDQLTGDWYAVSPEVVDESRSRVESILRELVEQGRVEGSIVSCHPASAAAILLDAIERFHTWTGRCRSRAMMHAGMTEDPGSEAWRRGEEQVLRLFEGHWQLLYRMLST